MLDLPAGEVRQEISGFLPSGNQRERSSSLLQFLGFSGLPRCSPEPVLQKCSLPIALDATYSIGRSLSGVGVYCNEMLLGLARAHPEQRFTWCYRPHRYLRSFRAKLPANCSRYFLHDRWRAPRFAELFHGLNQRLPEAPLPRAVATFHDLFVMTGEYSTPEFRARFTRLAKDAAARADIIITVSQFTADQVTQLLGFDRSRIRVVHHGVRAYPVSESRENIVLHVGALQRRKNIIRLVQAFESAAPGDWRLVLAGAAGYGAEEIMLRIERSPARARIEVRGFLDDESLHRLYGRASILAFPSLDEGFGMPVLEAMAAGTPVLCSDSSALPEVAGDAALLIDAQSVESIAEGLKRLIEEPDLRSVLRARGLDRASEFTWDNAVRKTLAVYSELL
jgi:glycosyltransferase involved in cell wall biosynthesis